LSGDSSTTRHQIGGIAVVVENTRPDINTGDVVSRLGHSLGLIDRYTPHYGRHLRHDLSGILVKRYACRGAYFFDSRTCLVELTFCVNPTISLSQIAATLLHEGMHARLHALRSRLRNVDRAREERFCRRAEIEFGRLVPDGSPIVERALEALSLGDDEVAPVVDERIAAQRIAQADAAAAAARERGKFK
jgi:hypothetical protein